MRLRFVVPTAVELPTGGNVYDVNAAAALESYGDDVDLVRVEPERLGKALEQPWNGHTLVDGLLISHQPAVAEASSVAVLVHMPSAWQLGLTPEESSEAELLEGRTLRAAAAVVATSAWTARFLERRYQLSDVLVALPGAHIASPVDGSDPPLLVHVAAMLPHKNQLSVVGALTQVKDLPWRARFVGSTTRAPDYAAAVREAVTAHGLSDRVEITGELDREIAWEGADLALLPSLVESYGMVVTEALARGIPAIVSEGGPAEALGFDPRGDRPGDVIAADDVDALARRLRQWLSDPDLRERWRSSAIARRATLDGWEVTARWLREGLMATA